jgi:nucleotide-binding universal stress UspA family protein
MRVSVQHGDPVGVILLHAHSRRSDLIVLGTHGRTGLDRLRAGSVAERVARQAACPVLVVPVPPAGAGDEVSGSFRNVVCPIDFSDASGAGLEQALRVVDQDGGQLTLMHVVAPLDLTEVSRYAYHFTVPEYGRRLQRDAWQRLQDIVPADLRTTNRLRARVVSGAPADGIARVAREIEADLIVMGVTSRGPVGRTLFGSTAVRVMGSAGRPGLAVPEVMRKRPLVDTESNAAKIAA